MWAGRAPARGYGETTWHELFLNLREGKEEAGEGLL